MGDKPMHLSPVPYAIGRSVRRQRSLPNLLRDKQRQRIFAR
jgi:hypothetical protein